ncbi:MAG TPA: helix-hairpin-helix domain-containing protein [Phycisphaerae bacterium]|nr:helix-hairpin-helix domain-containing protein [Phycisphaerae bacterium]
MPDSVTVPPTRRQALVARGEQLVLVILALAVVAGVAYRAIDYLRLGQEPLEVIPAAPPTYQIDVNSADWVLLALMPGLGESLAKRIVAEREQRGGRFAAVDDLKAVRGIGDKTLARLRPFLFVATDRPAGAEPVRMSAPPPAAP